MDTATTLQNADTIMERFARETGLRSGADAPRRYLWTDAFAVCNFLALHQLTGTQHHLDDALLLVGQVHEVLGKHRPDDSRTGWISGLSDADAMCHPTAGGLRIGKRLAERTAEQPLDEHLEWERDGQYYHYLTKWMHALHQISGSTGNPEFNRWARELADVAHRAFCFRAGPVNVKRLYWKMNIDLTRPLVESTGHHDPLDGLITFHELAHQWRERSAERALSDLSSAIIELSGMCRDGQWVTADPLGLGGLLFDACRMMQLESAGCAIGNKGLLAALLDASIIGLGQWLLRDELSLPIERRLAFRELGLAIGLHGVPLIRALARCPQAGDIPAEIIHRVDRLMDAVPLAGHIDVFWLDPLHQKSDSWREHEDINQVMLACSLLPDGFLKLAHSGLR